jgi:hypothetical protein
MLEVDKDECR